VRFRSNLDNSGCCTSHIFGPLARTVVVKAVSDEVYRKEIYESGTGYD
jgi:hypothetical protein